MQYTLCNHNPDTPGQLQRPGSTGISSNVRWCLGNAPGEPRGSCLARPRETWATVSASRERPSRSRCVAAGAASDSQKHSTSSARCASDPAHQLAPLVQSQFPAGNMAPWGQPCRILNCRDCESTKRVAPTGSWLCEEDASMPMTDALLSHAIAARCLSSRVHPAYAFASAPLSRAQAELTAVYVLNCRYETPD